MDVRIEARTSARTRGRRRAAVGAAAFLAVGSLLLAACSEEEAAPDASEPSAEDGTSRTMGEAEAIEWMLEYSGGPGGEAEGEPYRIGFAHSDAFFPEGEAAVEVALELVNSELGGVGGRPLELVTCDVATPQDGAACGARFANDEEIDFVVSGLVLHGNADLYGTLDGKAAALMSTPLDASDYVTPHAVSYTTGALGAGMGGAVFVNEDLRPKTTALVVTDDVAGRGGASVLTPIAEEAGVEVAQVFVPPTATAPEIAAALQAAGAATADVVSLGLFEQGCIAAYDAIRSLSIDPLVATTGVCAGDAMREHVRAIEGGEAPEGWYFVGGSLLADELPEGARAYLAVMDRYGAGDIAHSVAAPLVFDVIVTAAKVLNEVGVENATYEAIDEAVRGFTGPAMFQSGPIECGVPPYVAVCASEVAVARYVDGGWELVRSELKGNPVDISPYLRPGG
ncbi:MAG TPA: ABC transporter substrate-binding protein [Microthrixaceae bacterium]|nr:ABC transporter substrate-binding protein [Microthrixaceae bacterium]